MVKHKVRVFSRMLGTSMLSTKPFADTATSIEKVLDEAGEHFGWVRWVARRLLLPLVVIYVAAGFLTGTHVLPPLFFALALFLYSNFLPDFDVLINYVRNPRMASPWQRKYYLLCFAPVYVYYLISEDAERIYSVVRKPFHRRKAMLAYGAFLLFFGILLFGNLVQAAALPIFGMLGYALHLLVDGCIGRW